MGIEDIEISILNADNPGDDKTLQGVVDLYANHPEIGTNEAAQRRIDSVENLKNLFRDKFTLVIAQQDGKVVGSQRLESDKYNDEDHVWMSTFFVSENAQGKGIGSKIYQASESLISEMKQEQDLPYVILGGGIEKGNDGSARFHTARDWVKTGDIPSESDADGIEHEYEHWEKKL